MVSTFHRQTLYVSLVMRGDVISRVGECIFDCFNINILYNCNNKNNNNKHNNKHNNNNRNVFKN